MLHVIGNDIELAQGETLPLSVPISGADLTGATAVLICQNGDNDPLILECDISGSTATIVVDSATTAALLGEYNYEIWIMLLGGQNSNPRSGMLKVKKSRFNLLS